MISKNNKISRVSKVNKVVSNNENASKLKIIPLGGLHEVGKNMTQ